jgi:hypothetical protein
MQYAKIVQSIVLDEYGLLSDRYVKWIVSGA